MSWRKDPLQQNVSQQEYYLHLAISSLRPFWFLPHTQTPQTLRLYRLMYQKPKTRLIGKAYCLFLPLGVSSTPPATTLGLPGWSDQLPPPNITKLDLCSKLFYVFLCIPSYMHLFLLFVSLFGWGWHKETPHQLYKLPSHLIKSFLYGGQEVFFGSPPCFLYIALCHCIFACWQHRLRTYFGQRIYPIRRLRSCWTHLCRYLYLYL